MENLMTVKTPAAPKTRNNAATRAAADREEACAELRTFLRPGQTVYTVLRHVSKSGMQREISLYVVDSEGGMHCIDYLAARAAGYKRGKHDGLVAGGCGMDMGFAIVYNLGASMWRNGTPAPHGRRNGQDDSSGGYALKHRWL